MKNIINFRPFFFLFIISILCIFCGVKLNTSLFYLFGFLIPIVFLGFLIYKKKYVLLSFSLIIILFLSSYSFVFVKNYTDKSFENEEYIISARIENINEISTNYYYLTLSHATFIDENGDKKSINGKISLGLSNYDDTICFNTFDMILFSSSLEGTSFYNEKGEVNSFYLKNDIRYTTKSLETSDVVFYSGESSFLENLRVYNLEMLEKSFGEEQGALIYAILYGDKSEVEDEYINDFKISGIIHIFTVSGLHVGFIVALLYFLLKKLKVNNFVCFIVSCICLTLFCFVCSFTASVVRATIMALTVLFAKVVFKKNDFLNTFSFSGVLLLIINPLNLFDGGFQMSFTAVFGIICFGSLFKKFQIKNKVIKNIFLFVCVSLSTQLALLPIFAKYYGFLATWSLISNLIILPIFSIFYPLLFIINLLVLICPILSFLYFLPKCLLTIIIFLNSLIIKLPFNTIEMHRWGLLASSIYYVFMFSISKYLLLKWNFKLSVSLLILFCVIVSSFIYNIPFYNKTNSIVFYSNNFGYSTLITTNNNKYYLIEPIINKNCVKKIKTDLFNKKIFKLDGVFVSSNQNFEAKLLSEFLFTFKCPIYLSKNFHAITNLKQLKNDVIIVEDDYMNIEDKFEICFLNNDENMLTGIKININEIVFAILNFNNLNMNNTEILDFITTNMPEKIDFLDIICDNIDIISENYTYTNLIYKNSSLIQVFY